MSIAQEARALAGAKYLVALPQHVQEGCARWSGLQVTCIDHAIKKGVPFICISKSGGARMMEAGLSLMQMAKTSAKLSLLSKEGLPFVSLLTDPTTGGVTASFAMLGDLNISEPNALIGFAGPRVVKETIGKDLPAGFQRAEFVLEHGFLDAIVPRVELKEKLAFALKMLHTQE